MKPALQAKLGAGLALTPQLRQAIRLLQLSGQELEQELREATETNPLLELLEDGQPDTSDDDEATADADDDWAERHDPTGPRDEPDDREDAAATAGLHEHLLWQLRMDLRSARDLAIGAALIDALDDDGYLREPLSTVTAALRRSMPVNEDEVRAVLRRVQRLDPLGCGARDLGECLRLQLGALAPDTPGLALARRLADGHLDAVAKARPERLAADLGETTAGLAEALALLRSLDPKPGARLSAAATDYVQPDAIVLRRRGAWVVRLVRGPRLALNQHYERMIGHCNRADDSYLRAQLQEARWLLKALEHRGDTLLWVAETIARVQTPFLDHGLEAMRPLTLRDVALPLGLHESTISRATTRKYLRTPRGTFEFKYFFSTGLAAEHGRTASATAVQAMLKRLIDAEPADRPLSDQALADALKAAGIAIARRTVTKYREGLGLGPSSERGGASPR